MSLIQSYCLSCRSVSKRAVYISKSALVGSMLDLATSTSSIITCFANTTSGSFLFSSINRYTYIWFFALRLIFSLLSYNQGILRPYHVGLMVPIPHVVSNICRTYTHIVALSPPLEILLCRS